MKQSLVVTVLVSSVLFGTGSAPGEDRPSLKDALALEEAFQDAIKVAEPSVACILVSRSSGLRVDLSSTEAVPESYGSGVVIDEKGLILTNYHVVRDSSQRYVRLPGMRGSWAEIYAADPRSDLAVLRLTDPLPGRLPALRLGDGDRVRKGQIVLSLANPFAAGFVDGSPSASWGIISNIRRRAPGRPTYREQDRAKLSLHHFGTLLQVDARLNLGCSGGALIDLKGELIGLTSSLAALTGVETPGGFAVPMSTAMKRIIGQLREGKEVEYGFLGVTADPDAPAFEPGIRIGYAVAGSPAAQAGLRDRQQIVRVNGTPIQNNDDLFLAIGTELAGAETRLDVSGQREPVMVRLAKYYVSGPIIATNKPPVVKGLRVDYTSVLYQRHAAPRGEIPTGVYVSEIVHDSPAAKELVLEQVITHVNGQPIATPEEFYRAARQAAGSLELTLGGSVDGGGEPRKVVLN